jgi:hypothetical protein
MDRGVAKKLHQECMHLSVLPGGFKEGKGEPEPLVKMNVDGQAKPQSQGGKAREEMRRERPPRK